MLPEIVRASGELGGVEESPLPRPCLAGHRDPSENGIEELSRGGGGAEVAPTKPVGVFML